MNEEKNVDNMEEKKTDNKHERIKCSMVVIGFYLIVYAIIGGKLVGFLNPWLIGIILILVVIDIKALRWYMEKYETEDEDEYP